MSFDIAVTESQCRLVLGQEVSIADAAALHRALLTSDNLEKAWIIEASRVVTVHSSILQLLMSLKKTVSNFELRVPSSEFMASVNRLGLTLLVETKSK